MSNTVVRMKYGSHLYGTETPFSDLDFRGVYIPDARNILLGRTNNTHKSGPEKAHGTKNQVGDIDTTNYSIQKYFDLLASGDTGAIDMLFAPQSAIIESSPIWGAIQQNRKRFLSKKSAAFLGYCRQQANKYGIKGSRIDSAKKAMEFFAARPMMAKVGEFIKEIEEQLTDEHSRIVIPTDVRDMTIHFECCNRKVPLTATVKMAHEIFIRIYQNYGDRARLAQSNEGVDWKALSHAVRVGQEAMELLMDHRVTFPLPNAEFIRDIKAGKHSYQVVSEEIERLLSNVEWAAAHSTLPDNPDREFMDNMLVEIHKSQIDGSVPSFLINPENFLHVLRPRSVEGTVAAN